ncbi:hypothetical protein MBANPS3_000694 [Mucor bainieri]
MSNTSDNPSATDRSTAGTSQASTSTASTAAATTVISTTLTGVLGAIEAMKGTGASQEDDPSTKYPVLIGSRAAHCYIPSFRPFSDWDVVATPQQAINMLRQQGEQANNTGLLKIKLIKQALVHEVIKRRPTPPADIQERIRRLPTHLYKVSGETAESLAFEIEVIDYQDPNSAHSSAVMLLNLCNTTSPPDELTYLSFAIGTGQKNQAIVAPVELLEAIKTSHIYWPVYFEKHIADLHALRALLAADTSATVNLGYHADKTKPLTPPARSPQVEEFLVVRTLETEAFRGTPGAHINLNVSNEEFLGRENDLFVARRIPHDDIHTMVMYGSEPVYDGLKTDKSKAMLSRALFEQAPYVQQLHCVKEEAMVIALERFLVPKLTSDPASAYRSALIRICTTLTKGWFRQFAVDNFPRLGRCDKDLLPIRDAILENHPPAAPVQTSSDLLSRLKESITNLDDLYIVQQLVSLGKATTLNQISSMLGFGTLSSAAAATSTQTISHYGKKRGYRQRRETDTVETRYWVINSNTSGRPVLLISFTQSHYWNGETCEQESQFHGTLAVQPLNTGITLEQIRNPPADCQKAVADASSELTGSWGGEDIWGGCLFVARPLAKEEVFMLDVDGLTEDLLMAYIMNLARPTLGEGNYPLEEDLHSKMVEGLIPMPSHNHRWFDLWKYYKANPFR